MLSFIRRLFAAPVVTPTVTDNLPAPINQPHHSLGSVTAQPRNPLPEVANVMRQVELARLRVAERIMADPAVWHKDLDAPEGVRRAKFKSALATDWELFLTQPRHGKHSWKIDTPGGTRQELSPDLCLTLDVLERTWYNAQLDKAAMEEAAKALEGGAK